MKEIKEIDYIKIWRMIIGNIKTYCIILPITFIVSCALILCVPRYYTCEISMAPETSDNSGTLGSLASSMGLGSMSKLLESEDAIFPELYPDIVGSSQFITNLFNEKVTTKNGNISCDYYTYILKHQDAPFWEKAKAWIAKKLSSSSSATSITTNNEGNNDILILSKDQTTVIKAIQGKIDCAVDKKTGVIHLSVTDQDPIVAANMCSTVSKHLQEFITSYRTTKARNDLAYFTRLSSEAKERYENARRKYSSFSDANMEVSLASVRTKLEDMENDMQLLYNAYSTICTQKQAAEAKVQESTPAFTLMEKPVVPIKPAGPKRIIFVAFMLILSFVATTAYIFFKNKE